MSTGHGTPPQLSRRSLLSSAAAVALLQMLPTSQPQNAMAAVDIDIERFGDKGMKTTPEHSSPLLDRFADL